jgi:hypothetical protein
MAVLPLPWKQGEGHDIHVLRGGPPSKSLLDAVEVSGGITTAGLFFTPQFEGAPNAHFVEVDSLTGVVTARLHTDPSKFKLHNFIMTVSYVDTISPGGQEYQTEIRIHIHDSVEDIWLTPSVLTIHKDADESRFTVLAKFSDKIVGDITDWPDINYQSDNPAAVSVRGGGVLKAEASSGSANITASLGLTSPVINKIAAPVKVNARPDWTTVAGAAEVLFVAGKIAPNKRDASSTARDSVKSVVEGATNVLFIAEGFRKEQRGDFNNLVCKVVSELRTTDHLMPFRLLKDSINYWSVFMPSEEEGITVLGEWLQGIPDAVQHQVPLPRSPASTATAWSVTDMIHEVGLPTPDEVEIPFIDDHVKHWEKLYGSKATKLRTQVSYPGWTTLGFRMLLNERGTAFGLSLSGRSRVVKGDVQRNSVRADPRRTSEANLMKFFQGVTFGGHPLGDVWKPGGKDFGLVSFVCVGDTAGGQQHNVEGYFAACFGTSLRVPLRPATALGRDVITSPLEKHSRTLFASVWAHECGHAFGLWDEYGDALGTSLTDPASVEPYPNVLAKSSLLITTTDPSTGTTTTTFGKAREIKWRWPRVFKAGVLAAVPFTSGVGLRVLLRPGHGRAFRPGDVVQFRQWPLRKGASMDPFLSPPRSIGFVFKVLANGDNSVDVNLVTPGGDIVDMNAQGTAPGSRSWKEVMDSLFALSARHAIICPHVREGKELSLVAEPIFTHIAAAGPLNAEPGFDPTLCVRASSIDKVMTPTNLPPLSNIKSLIEQDIIGIYEGGSYHDCGVYRPAGRCRMRSGYQKTIPFCHVCRYLIVDRVDPTLHGALDAIYEKQYPKA